MSVNDDTRPRARRLTPFEVDLDPVCGEEIAEPDESLMVTRNAQRFYFCCERCKTRFLLEPDRYLPSSIEIK